MTSQPPTSTNRPGVSGSRRSRLIFAGLASVIAVGVAVPSVVGGGADAETIRPNYQVSASQTVNLEDLSLGDLAEELDRLGLELTINPAASATHGPSSTDQDTPISESDNPQPADQDSPAEESGIDPFEGMTDEEIDALSDEEFFDLLDQAGYDADFDEFDPDEAETDTEYLDDESPLASFQIENGELVSREASPEQIDQANQIWSRFTQIIPAGQRQMLSGFELMAAEYGGAHVYPADDDPSRWILGVGLAIEGSELDYVLVHEFGHLLTLQASEVPPSTGSDSCPTYNPGEGCALSQSTLSEFVDAFWPQTMRDEIERIAESGDYEAQEAFYQANSDKFVTDYATTNPVEDLAETFAAFVLNDQPSGDTVADQKIQMLWDDDAMVSLRSEIRSRI